MPARSRLPRPLGGVPVPTESPPRLALRRGRGATKRATLRATLRSLILRWRLRGADRELLEARRILEALAYTAGKERTVYYERVNRLTRRRDQLLDDIVVAEGRSELDSPNQWPDP